MDDGRALGDADAGGIDVGKAWRREHGIPVVGVFDGFRGLAIVAVVAFHSFTAAGVYSTVGNSVLGAFAWALPAGLISLFIVSGFVLYLPTVARDGDFGSVGHFAIRRAARLVPGYWLVLVVAIVLLALLALPLPDLVTVGAHIGLVQTPALLVDPGFSLGFGVVPPVWTLSVELLFYIVLPLVASRWLRRPLLGLALAAGIAIGWHFLSTNITDVASAFGIQLGPALTDGFANFYASQFPAWTFAFGCGMTGAIAYVRLRERGVGRRGRHRAALTALAAAAAVLGFAYLSGHRAITDVSAFQVTSLPIGMGMAAAMTVLFVALSAAPSAFQRPFANRPIRWLADVSYGVYLIHFAVIWFALQELSLPQEGNVESAAIWLSFVLLPSILYGYLSARLVERPVRAWAHRFGRRAAVQQPPPTEPAPAPTPAPVPTVAARPPLPSPLTDRTS
jgi:peptidoglycan/LPS O-acetylase OafA/YrhL